MIERFIDITNFRSIGINGTSTLELNYVKSSSEKMGGLITLIGENNSGKSNYLDAIKSFGEKKFNQNDTPFHVFDANRTPSISLILKDTDKNLDYKVKVKENRTFYDKYESNNEVPYKKNNEYSKELSVFIEYFVSNEFENLISNNPRVVRYYQLLNPFFKKLSSHELIDRNEAIQMYEHLRNPYVQSLINQRFPPNQIEVFINEIANITSSNIYEEKAKEMENEVLTTYGIRLYPKIINYINTNNIKTDHTISSVSSGKLTNPNFFSKLYDILPNDNFEVLESIYKKFHESGKKRKDILTNYERSINESLVNLTNEFNQVYSFTDKKKYSFRMSLESEYVYFLISENGFDIPLDNQSAGFKWFFDFFFNVFADSKIGNGDIVILDEPATNLHPAGQIELRKQIQGFGHKNGILFIMSTHSPFMIDQDYLDEIRLVKKNNQDSTLINKFTVNEDSSFDVLLPIKSALTVNRHILLNPDDVLIFVEGITDYNYLIAFKNYFKIDKLSFIPIQGIRRPNLDQDLMKIVKKPILLVDSDDDGKYVVEKYGKNINIEIRQLATTDSKFIEIESLFSEGERLLYCFKENGKKNYKLSSYFKQNFDEIKKKISKQTKDNFEKLLKDLNV
ncbi:MAG: AAA family ATPase [Acholeplasma sp.]|nr:AAA family ATPase [Acholeplasma sp.]